MHYLAVFLLSVCVAMCVATTLEDPYKTAAQKVCNESSEQINCCETALRLHRPINCSTNLMMNQALIYGLEAEINGSDSAQRAFCCLIFQDKHANSNDCFEACTSTMQTPSVTNKVERIGVCYLALKPCFEKCLQHDHKTEGHFNFSCGQQFKNKETGGHGQGRPMRRG